MATTEQKKRLLKAKIAVALQLKYLLTKRNQFTPLTPARCQAVRNELQKYASVL